MIPMSLAEVARAVGGRLDAVPDATVHVTATIVDSRRAGPGVLFVALRGERVDGHAFAAQAAAAGAVAVLAVRPVGVPAIVVDDVLAALAALAGAVRDRAAATVVGITGSSGKTSTKDLLAVLLAPLGPTVAAPGSYNNEIGLPLTLLRVDRETRTVVLEMGARGIGHVAALARTARPDVGVVLNVGSAHLGEYSQGRAGIALAKGELAEAARDAVVLNADDPLVAAMGARARTRLVTFGVSSSADVRAERVEVDEHGRAAFDLVAGGERHRVALRLVGAHQVPNSLAAAATALHLGLPPAAGAQALAAATPRSRWRMEVRGTADGVTVVNDAYNANPESVRAALAALAAMSRGRRSWAVLGEMAELGAAADTEHEAVGRGAVELGVDRVVAVGERARGIRAGAPHSAFVPDADAAVALLSGELRPGDVVLVKASRVARLERVAEALLASAEVPP